MRKYRSRVLPLSAFLFLVAAPYAGAQPKTETTILANPTGPWFNVDGTTFFTSMSAFWPVGSTHMLSIPSGTGYSYNGDLSIQYQFAGWQWGTGQTNAANLQVTADPTITRYTANFSTLYKFSLQLICQPDPCTSAPGAVTVDGVIPAVDSSWQSPGSVVALQAFSSPGYLFKGWQVGTGPVTPGVIDSVTMNTPAAVSAIFTPAKTVNLATNPSGLYVYADGVLVTAPITMQWGVGTSHTVVGLSVQNDDTQKRWTWQAWSDGGAETHDYVVGRGVNPETLTATYAAAAYPLFLTSPPNLNLVIDGAVLPPPYGVIWGVGSTHQINAPSPQKDSQGNTLVFQSWDDLVTTPTRTVTVPVGADTSGLFRFTALYSTQQQVKLTVSSSLAGQTVTVDGASCTTPCTVTRNAGTQVRVSAPASIPGSSGSRQDLLGWSMNGGAPAAGDWVGTLNAATTSIAASYHLMNNLSASSSPSAAGRLTLAPGSADGYYDSQTVVQVSVAPRPGYRFGGWSGDLSGASPTGSLSMSVPRQIMAELKPAPHVVSSGIGRIVGTTDRPSVAAGSHAAIYGLNLASATENGPAAPLARNLAGVSVRIGSRQLALYAASPTEIDLQIPPDLEPGPQTLTVSAGNMPDAVYEFNIVRNAPGLFPVADGEQSAMVMHEDGSAVTAAAPAKRGELLTLYGTGFGPTSVVRPDGAAVPRTPAYLVLDPVTVQVGSGVFTPESAFAVPGQVGFDAAQFRLDSSAPSGSAIPLSVTVNGVASNLLMLAVE